MVFGDIVDSRQVADILIESANHADKRRKNCGPFPAKEGKNSILRRDCQDQTNPPLTFAVHPLHSALKLATALESWPALCYKKVYELDLSYCEPKMSAFVFVIVGRRYTPAPDVPK